MRSKVDSYLWHTDTRAHHSRLKISVDPTKDSTSSYSVSISSESPEELNGSSGSLSSEAYPGRRPAHALDDICQQGTPPTDDFGGPSGKGVPSATAEARLFLGPPRPSSTTHPEVVLATVTCSYIVGLHRWILGWGN